MKEFIEIEELPELLSAHKRLIDVRAEVEFERSSLPQAFSLPLLSTRERERVGTTYKQSGQSAAIELGHQLVHGNVRDMRVARWREAVQRDGAVALYCARGGLRSEISQRWLAESGVSIPRVRGGFKTIRQFLLETIEFFFHSVPLVVIEGRTGVGKTRVLATLASTCSVIDLEQLASHKGSVFGATLKGQPTQATFENMLALRCLEIRDATSPVIIEAESARIGNLFIPKAVSAAIKRSAAVLLEVPLDERVTNIRKEYILERMSEFAQHNADPIAATEAFLQDATKRLGRRLGDERTRKLSTQISEAFQLQRETNDSSLHDAWIRDLIGAYYDPFYDRGIELAAPRIIAKGSAEQILHYFTGKKRADFAETNTFVS